MNVLILGGNSFIGRGIAEAFLRAGATVHSLARTNDASISAVHFHSLADYGDEKIQQLLSEIDVIINCWGILTGTSKSYQYIHYQLPKKIAEFALHLNIRFIQISAIGPESEKFISSKYQFDRWLMENYPNSLVIRPSVVISSRGSYGGTSLFRAIASLPLIVLLPGDGCQKLRPILLEELAEAVRNLSKCETESGRILYASGKKETTLHELIAAIRGWLGKKTYLTFNMPIVILSVVTKLVGRFTNGPLGETTLFMLEQGNTCSDNELAVFETVGGVKSSNVIRHFEQSACYVQERWFSNLYLLSHINLFFIFLVWLVSGISGFMYQPDSWSAILAPLSSKIEYQKWIVYGLSCFDILMALLMLKSRWRAMILNIMLFSLIAYTMVVFVLNADLLLDPLGGLIKNLSIIVCTLFALVTNNRK